ncbi:hypothetical protein H920_05435 [Fukomys damarensis]|uniref:Uncharacterized protein n=1 Tax=Fukomys damarensis TaxID=885580 RepID=A0A091DQC2_FUKDA|nr:hypothetical protein H920_05435 [Fukomys damarensis]
MGELLNSSEGQTTLINHSVTNVGKADTCYACPKNMLEEHEPPKKKKKKIAKPEEMGDTAESEDERKTSLSTVSAKPSGPSKPRLKNRIKGNPGQGPHHNGGFKASADKGRAHTAVRRKDLGIRTVQCRCQENKNHLQYKFFAYTNN